MIRYRGSAMAKMKILVLPDMLMEALGFSEKDVEIKDGKYKFREIIEILKKSVPELSDVLKIKELNKEIFIAINGQVFYDLNYEIEIKEDMRISLFTVGAGG